MPKGIFEDDYLSEDDDLRQAIFKHMERSRSGERARRDIDTIVNLRWYRGEPFWRRGDANMLQQIKPSHRAKYVNNMKYFESLRTVNGVFSYVPKFDAWPVNQDGGDRARARMTKTVGNHVVQNCGMPRAIRYVQDLVGLGGYCTFKPVWDHSAGPQVTMLQEVVCDVCGGEGAIANPQTGIMAACTKCSAQGLLPAPYGEKGVGYVEQANGKKSMGDVRWHVVPPWEYFPDPDANVMDEVTVVVHRRKMSRTEAWLTYGKAAGFSEADFHGPTSSDLDVGSTIMRSGPYGYQRTNDDNTVIVHEYWSNPDEKHPDGVFGVMIGDTEVIFGRLPYVINRHPFFTLCGYELYGALYPLSTADLILPLCQALNDHVTSSHVRARLTAKLKWLTPKESGFAVDDETGIISYRHMAGRPAPQVAQIPSAPTDSANLIQFLADAVERVSGGIDVLRGSTEGVGGNARAGAWFDEQARAPLMPIVTAQAEVMDKAVKFGVDLFKIHAESGRKMRLRGDAGGYEVAEFDDGMVGDSDDIHISMVRDMRGRSARMDELKELAEMQAITPQELRQASEFNDLNGLQQTQQLHENMARQEVETLKQTGYMPPPAPYQKHDIHIECHVQDLAEIELNNPQDPLAPAIREHIQQTLDQKAQEAAAEQQRLMMAQQAMMPAAQTYGMANGADGSAQPQSSQAAVANGGATDAPNAPAGAPGTQDSLQQAASAARSSDTAVTSAVGGQ